MNPSRINLAAGGCEAIDAGTEPQDPGVIVSFPSCPTGCQVASDPPRDLAPEAGVFCPESVTCFPYEEGATAPADGWWYDETNFGVELNDGDLTPGSGVLCVQSTGVWRGRGPKGRPRLRSTHLLNQPLTPQTRAAPYVHHSASTIRVAHMPLAASCAPRRRRRRRRRGLRGVVYAHVLRGRQFVLWNRLRGL